MPFDEPLSDHGGLLGPDSFHKAQLSSQGIHFDVGGDAFEGEDDIIIIEGVEELTGQFLALADQKGS